MEQIRNKELGIIFHILGDIMKVNRDYLIELDAAIGDGDLGITMSKGFAKIAELVDSIEEADLGKYLMNVGMTMADTVPSTMGTLVATGFMKAGKALKGIEIIDTKELGILFEAFVNGIMERGKAKPGEKTVVDSLYGAANALKGAAEKELDLRQATTLAYNAAKEGLESTKKMKATYGKAAIYQEKSIGKQDPGATVGKLIVEGFYQGIVQS